MKKFMVGTTLMVLVLLAASAAPAQDFKGFYVGGYVGAAAGRSRPTLTVTDSGGAYFAASSVTAINAAGNQNLNTNVLNAGGEVGYNFQSEEGFVFGAEADFGTMRLDKDVSTTVTYPCCAPNTFTVRQVIFTDYLITARARIGWAHKRALYYVTGGLAATNLNPYTGMFHDTILAGGQESVTNDRWMTGWTIGTGVEFKASRHVSLKGEYLYADFGDITLIGTDLSNGGIPIPNVPFQYTTDLRAHILRGGINYIF